MNKLSSFKSSGKSFNFKQINLVEYQALTRFSNSYFDQLQKNEVKLKKKNFQELSVLKTLKQ